MVWNLNFMGSSERAPPHWPGDGLQEGSIQSFQPSFPSSFNKGREKAGYEKIYGKKWENGRLIEKIYSLDFLFYFLLLFYFLRLLPSSCKWYEIKVLALSLLLSAKVEGSSLLRCPLQGWGYCPAINIEDDDDGSWPIYLGFLHHLLKGGIGN